MGNLGRYANHSCEPNLTPAAGVRAGKMVPEVALFACRDVASGEELTFHYGESNSQEENRTPCLCGAKSCQKFLPSARDDLTFQ